MNLRKHITLVFFLLLFLLLLFLLLIILRSCGGREMRPEKALKNFVEEIEIGNLAEYSLTIYYLSPYAFTLYPISVDDLINRNHEYKILIDGEELEKKIDLFVQMDKGALIPVEQESRINARIHYVFSNTNAQKAFNVSMWGEDESIFINGFEMKENPIFYDIIMPFLNEDIMTEFGMYLLGKDN
jgi:hypothetical protein